MSDILRRLREPPFGTETSERNLMASAADEIAALRTVLAELVKTFDDLIEHSQGVYGLHLNGEPSPWSELAIGGQFETWVGLPLEDARATIAKAEGR